MQRKNLLWILLTVLITTIIATLPMPTKAVTQTMLSVTPQISNADVGNTFSINFTVVDVNKLWGYQIYLKYNTTVLTATSFQNLANLTYAAFKDPEYSAIDDAAGIVVIAMHSFMGDHDGFTSLPAVPLASITFRVDALGTSKLEFGTGNPTKTVLADADGNAIDPQYSGVYPILLLINGHFSNTGEVTLHDIAVTSVAASPTEVKPGDAVSIAATVKNNGGFNENFTVSAYYDVTHKIQTLAVTNLAPGASQPLTFTWTTTGIVEGSYVVSAKAEVTLEDNPLDNTLSGNTVTVKIPGGGFSVNLWYIVGGIVVVIAVAIGVYVLRARKK